MNLRQKYRYALIGAALIILAFLLHPQPIYACACCGETGQWFETTRNLEPSELDTLNELKFAPVARLFSGDREDSSDLIRGIERDALSGDPYTLSRSTANKSWNLRLTSSKGKSGHLSFTLPSQGTFFGADLYDQPTPDSRLYRELRLQGKVAGDGIFKPGMSNDTQFKLILQWRGNNCIGDIQHWNLQISGAKANYSFFGEMMKK